MTNYEQGLEKLNNELEAAKAYAAARNLRSEEISNANIASVANLFNTALELKHLRKEWSYRDNTSNKWSIAFYQPGNRGFSGLEFEFDIIEDNIQVNKFNCPSMGNSPSATGNVMDQLVFWTTEVNRVVTTLSTQGADIVNAINNFGSLEPKDETIREAYEIERDIESFKEMGRVSRMELRVGANLMVATTGHQRSRGYGWQNCTITKINKKSIQFVINYPQKDGTITHSYMQAIPLNYQMLRSLEEHEALRQEAIDKEWVIQKKWNPEIKREEVRVRGF